MVTPIPQTNTSAAFEVWAKKVAIENGFVLEEKLHQGTYYAADFVRDAVWGGTWNGKPAVLKLYDDPRMSDEPRALEAFHRLVGNGRLTAPALYASKMETVKRGWLITERLPEGGIFFKSPLSQAEKILFFDVYLEYRKFFPYMPTRPLTLAEQLPAAEFHRFRMAQWFRLAHEKEEERRANGQPLLLHATEFLSRFVKAMKIMDAEFAHRNMIWCHGHFKPQEVYRAQEKFYVTDFAHTKMYPEGYELAFIVWADCLMANWKTSYESWKAGIDTWIKIFRDKQEAVGFVRFDELLRVSLVERALGTILADVTGADRPHDEAEKRLSDLHHLLDELLAA